MKSGFSHFDSSHRENFCAAVLLLTMEVDDAVKDLVANIVRAELDIDASWELLGFGREARLVKTDDDNYARVDLWLLFGPSSDPSYAFIEVKTHEGWDAEQVVHQVLDQAERALARSARRIHGCVLLAPERLCQRVQGHGVRAITWTRLLQDLRMLRSPSPLTELAISHLEEQMDRPAGLDRPITMDQFEQATTTVGCLRQFLLDCIRDVGGRVKGVQLYTAHGDGRPGRASGWAWHGLSVPFALGAQKGRIGIYRYAEAPPGDESALQTLWLEAYLGEGDVPLAFVKFAPATLAAKELDVARAELKAEWERRAPRPADETS
jgi:hypothetical protein